MHGGQDEQCYERCGTHHQGDEVALEADALYIRISRNQILGVRFVPCVILADDFVEELLNEAKELAEWQTLFADVIRASEDSDDTTLDSEHFNRWQRSINMPLQTPGRVRARLMGSPSEESESSGAGHVISQVPNTPEVDMGFEVDPGTFEEATQAGIPETVVAALRDMAQAIDKANSAILGLHRNFGAVGGVMADDLHALDVRVQSLQTTVGTPRPIPNVVAGNVWEALAAVGSGASGSSGSAAAIDVQTRLGSLAAETRNCKQELTSVRADRDRMQVTVEGLKNQLAATLEIALGLQARLDSGMLEGGRVRMQPHVINLAGQDDPATAHLVAKVDFDSEISNLRAEVGLLKKHTASRGSISCFPDLLPGVNSLEDVYAWVTANFGGSGGGGGASDPDSSLWLEINDPGTEAPTFGPFCDIYVFLAAAEDLDSIMSKGDTLKEMDYIQKAGIKHPSEAGVIYSFKRAVPGIFGDGIGSGGASFLPALKTASDWESILSGDANAKPGLRDILTERHEAIESQLRGHIHDAFTSRGLGKVAELAREMLAASVKLLKLLMDYITTIYRNLVELSGFLPQDAWSLTTQVVRGIFIYMSNARSEIRGVSPKDSPIKNTSRVLYALLRTHTVMAEFV
jgi:hypothetical protein